MSTNETKWTPPTDWRQHGAEVEDRYGRILATFHPIAPPAVGIPEHPATRGEMEAEAIRLAKFARAAPEMYEALRRARAWLTVPRGATLSEAAIQSAINALTDGIDAVDAKAEGREP